MSLSQRGNHRYTMIENGYTPSMMVKDLPLDMSRQQVNNHTVCMAPAAMDPKRSALEVFKSIFVEKLILAGSHKR